MYGELLTSFVWIKERTNSLLILYKPSAPPWEPSQEARQEIVRQEPVRRKWGQNGIGD